MTCDKVISRYLLAIFVVLCLALVVPAAAQETGKLTVQPGETIEVGAEPIILDLINLRKADTFNPVTELRLYRDDDPLKQLVQVIGVPNDDFFKINVYTLKGKYGRYFAYSKQDGLIHENSIVFVHASTPTATETVATATETPAETPVATTATATTQAPLPGLIAIAALGICGLLAAAQKR
ncbi:hypothetical protein [Methanoculleus oceani]|uniref:PGF-CTERM sorting domain-containing protein n=1 Tax=Methanoculleus oceani TaxID=2184756 RepID=A0ABD4TD56_9EURY|nr:hypothetical protein [Methanoculleus sp. CWC-02]MCM2464824.1 hypothetical protein [Methanoculleus sp. CWC-02]